MISCIKEPFIDFGFDSPINKNSNGLVIADISHHIKNICLNGVISLEEGEVEVNLVNPNGVAVYSKTIFAPTELIVCESFNANPGYWKLKYVSRAGVGQIDLHLQKY
jgi:hypothetical protein